MSSTEFHSKDSPKVRFGLSVKLFVLVLISFGLLMGGIVIRVSVEAHQVASSTIQTSLNHSKQVLETRLKSRFRDIEETAYSIARDGRIQPLVYAEESASLQDQCNEFEQSLELDILIFTNSEGQVLARSDDPNAIGSFVARSMLFQSALSGDPARGIMSKDQKLLQIVAIPVFDNVAHDIVRGVIALAYSLSEVLASEIKNLTGSEIAFYSFRRQSAENSDSPPTEIYNTFETNQTLLSEHFAASSASWQEIYHKNSIFETTVDLGQETFHGLVRPLMTSDGSPVGFVIALRSRTELLRPFVLIIRQTMLTAIVCLLLAAIVAYLIAQHISKPIVQLVSVTKAIQDGNYPQGHAQDRRDEVGILYDAIHEMGQELKEKAELEDYLAGVSESIDEFENNRATISQALTIAQTNGNSTVDATQRLPSGKIVAERYRIEDIIGSGAAGMVYLANDIQLNEPLALKVIINPGLAGSALKQLKEEIRLARRITHRNVLRTYDFGTFDGVYFISMEYVKGYDLGQLIESKGPIDIKMGILLARQMCSAIAAAHNEGIIHRDLKPQNMMINKKGILKIMDFGIALNIGESESGSSESETTAAAQNKEILGTPNFMSPEQFSGKKLDHRTDIYSLGIILYYIFAGELPFLATSYVEVARKHIYETPPSITSIRSEVPQNLENLIKKALSKIPGDRFDSINTLHAELTDLRT